MLSGYISPFFQPYANAMTGIVLSNITRIGGCAPPIVKLTQSGRTQPKWTINNNIAAVLAASKTAILIEAATAITMAVAIKVNTKWNRSDISFASSFSAIPEN